nr:hypothetical protein [Candidatus Njordarchaeum guaymaensis]
MVNVRVYVTHVSGERLWGVENPLPAQVQMAINVNLLGFERKSPGMVEAPFVFTVSFTPSVAQISVKGTAQMTAEVVELDRIMEDFRGQKPPPGTVVQAVSSIAIAEAIVVAKTIGVPPPIPPFPLPSEQAKPKVDTRYTT